MPPAGLPAWVLPVLPGVTSHLGLSVFLFLPKSPHSVSMPNDRYLCLLLFDSKGRELEEVLTHLDVLITVGKPVALSVAQRRLCQVSAVSTFRPLWNLLPLLELTGLPLTTF